MKYSLEERRTIHKPVDKVFSALRDQSIFMRWNPWIIFDPDSKVEVSENPKDEGSWYSWDSKIIGAGKLTHDTIKKNEEIAQTLEFIRPFKSTNKNYFITKAISSDKTEVIWRNEFSVPIFFIFFVKNMMRMMKHDFSLGLKRFEAHIDKKAPQFTLDIGQVTHKESVSYVALPFQGPLSEFKEKASGLFEELINECKAQNIEFSLVGCNTLKAKYTKQGEMYLNAEVLAVVKPDTLAQVSAPLLSNQTKSGHTFFASYKGSYDFLEDQYRTLFASLRMNKHKFEKGRNFASIEFYLNSPADTPAHNLITEIYIPIREPKK